MTHKLDIDAAQKLILVPIEELCAPNGMLVEFSSMVFYRIDGHPDLGNCTMKTKTGLTLDVFYKKQGTPLGLSVRQSWKGISFSCGWAQEDFKLTTYLWPQRNLSSKEEFYHIEQSIVDYHSSI